MKISRLEAFSDGVFAIVITLLILDIRFPEVPYSQFRIAEVANEILSLQTSINTLEQGVRL